MSRNRHRESGHWQKPLSMLESLQASSSQLTTTADALAESVNNLKSMTSDFSRLDTVTKFEKKYELVSDADIRLAQQALTNKLLPEIHVILENAKTKHDLMRKEEEDLALKIMYQEKRIKELRQELQSSQDY
ncbi:hypothetical protein BCR43DRAFT_490541 [Syncephalastrum racemosum]|uniref:DASH complex subunit SPC19 n=1 Tax=Syncephalastrum racemosum TaxID=13706 RepID=A0A1X2HG62_SYNRA|nr:hypothetical protein BCR43DRAFT_490541 [Syncephalastrum racemosum]